MNHDELISDIAKAVLNLQNVLAKHNIGHATAINVPRETGAILKSLRSSGMFINRDVRKMREPYHCVTICGVDFDMDRS